MRTNLNLPELVAAEFDTRYADIAGDRCVLINPRGFPKFTKEMFIFRSSIWTLDGELVSAGLPKFYNWGEQPELYPEPKDINGCEFVMKVDGSSLIVSKYKGQTIIRTRGTFDARMLDNGFEIDILNEKYPKAFNNKYLDAGYSLVYEWVSNVNQIVVKYDECPNIYLIAKILHKDYSLARQSELDQIALDFGVKRPEVYSFNNITEMLEVVKNFKGKEGICLYYENGQKIKKVKGDWYIKLHYFKSNLNIKSMLDVLLQLQSQTKEDLFNEIEKQFDWECATEAKVLFDQVFSLKEKVDRIVTDIKAFVDSIRGIESRKDQAMKIMAMFGPQGSYCKENGCQSLSGYAFTILDNRPFDKETMMKIYEPFVKREKEKNESEL